VPGLAGLTGLQLKGDNYNAVSGIDKQTVEMQL